MAVMVPFKEGIYIRNQIYLLKWSYKDAVKVCANQIEELVEQSIPQMGNYWDRGL